MAHQFQPGEIAVEFVGDQNQYFLFRPLGMRVRGFFSVSRIKAGSTNTEYANLPDIPGIVVIVDIKKRIIRTEDPLSWKENKEVLREANRITGPWTGEGEPWTDIVRENVSMTELKSCLWAIRELIDTEDLNVLTGEVPGKPEIMDMKGDLQRRWFTNSKIEPKIATEKEVEQIKEDLVLSGERNKRTSVRPGKEMTGN